MCYPVARIAPTYLDGSLLVDPFLHRLTMGWPNGVEGVGPDGLVREFFATAPDPRRARLVHLVERRHVMAMTKDGADLDGTTRKRDELWRRWAVEVGERLPAAERSEELSAPCSWAARFPPPLRGIEGRLRVSIRHLAPEQRAVGDLLECIAVRGKAELLPVARLLEDLVARLEAEHGLIRGWRQADLGQAIDAVCLGARPHHRPYIRRAVNDLLGGRMGNSTAKLEGCGRGSAVQSPPVA